MGRIQKFQPYESDTFFSSVFDEERNVVDATSLSLDFLSEVTETESKKKVRWKARYGPVNKHLSLKICIKFDLQFN